MLRKRFAGLTIIVVASLLLGCGSSTHSTSSPSTPTATTHGTPAHGPNLKERLPGSSHAKRGSAAQNVRLHRGGQQPHLTGYEGESLPQKLAAMAADVVRVWSGVQPPPATLNVISDTPVTCQTDQGAVQVTTDDAPLYCQSDASLDLPVAYIQTNVQPIGDAAVLLLVADLYGYHILNALGDLTSSSGLTAAQVAQRDSCLGGLYFATIPTTHLSAADTDAVNNEIRAITSPGTPAAANAVTAQELTDSFNKGILAHASLKACLT